MVPLRPGQLLMSRVGMVLGAELVVATALASVVVSAVEEVDVGMLKFPGTDIEVTVTVTGGAVTKIDEFRGYGTPAVPMEVTVTGSGFGKVGVTMELQFADGVGKPEVARDVIVAFADGVGKPEVGWEEALRLDDGIGKLDIGREEMLRFADCVGKPEVGQEEVVQFEEGIGNPDVGSEAVGKPELGK